MPHNIIAKENKALIKSTESQPKTNNYYSYSTKNAGLPPNSSA